jgi:RNA polymerase sigma factor (sigma-70 family)
VTRSELLHEPRNRRGWSRIITGVVGQAAVVMWPSELVERYEADYRALVGVAYVLLGSHHEAEEVVQDAFVGLRGRWEDVENPGGYLRRSVVHGAYGALRRRDVAERHAPDAPPPDQPDQLVELRDVVLALPWRQRAAIVLRYVADLPDDEIASSIGCRRATVRSLVARGLKTIRSEVSDA